MAILDLMKTDEERLSVLRFKIEKLNSVSPTFCLAKWAQTTTTLYNGYTHSCHHPAPHKINVEDIKNNPSGIHNTPIKILAREEMLKGIQTKECDYCWNIENLGKDHFSDRHYKSANVGMNIWQQFENIVASGSGANFAPTYLEVAFESICNFKCSYCSPDVSSRWAEEVQQHGGYKLSRNKLHHDIKWMKKIGKFPIHHSEENPYIDAFWKWWPELYKSLTTFRITGGEPLLSNNSWKIIDEIIENPRADFKFSINTNMGVPLKLVEKLIDKLNLMIDKIAEIVIYTSAESIGEQAEYSRFGMDWTLFDSNIRTFLEKANPRIRLHFMTTVNILSVSTFDKFLTHISELRKRFGKNRVSFNVSYLRWPNHQCITNLDDEQKKVFTEKMESVIDTLSKDADVNGNLYIEEINQIKRLVDFMNMTPANRTEQKNFKLFFDEYDRRRNTNLLKTFPELTTMYNEA
jgi:organic radical activating enzyme